ncbi:hypothetical protein AVO42_00525 [Thiomicrospira sp. XS5]|uniref:hypothetical protein n=1 Tax=Thiomicrospira sp. XS5 TaxID=1775636 RepID=UPI00074863C4|nr:hypothetical protein [Thiomicrospira sp. XS5]KUJ73941.1 hypothetical protein AVO42_00525 [Thiomicrospira sp. XS5]
MTMVSKTPSDASVQTPLSVLQSVFGYEAFRSHQADIIDDVVAGQDCFVLMPTGGGKCSAIFGLRHCDVRFATLPPSK